MIPRIGVVGNSGVRKLRGSPGRGAQHEDAGVDDGEGEQRADARGLGELAERHEAGQHARRTPSR